MELHQTFSMCSKLLKWRNSFVEKENINSKEILTKPNTSAGDTDIKDMWYHLMGSTCSEYSQQRLTTSFPWWVTLQKGFYCHLLQKVVQM